MQNLKHSITAINNSGGAVEQGRFVYLDGTADRTVGLAVDSTGAPILGVAAHGCTADGDAFTVDIGGPGVMVELGATLSAGAYINAGAAGKAVAAEEGEYYAGYLLEGGQDGDLVQYVPQVAINQASAKTETA
ncbi:MAG: hypothetical protein CMB99_16380 [Flavobacteriaceae bacterium]|nr:hypothetical protein [Flavobacteriaceae bacterium]|tara:strand:- start:33215 stop:33613 length:399 start_codon:yes stop_codon:yes gene_type:complete